MRGWLVFVSLGGLAACATPYQAKGARGGYDDYPAGAGGAVMVSFEGNGYTSASTVLKLWHRRASEVCGGQQKYVVVDAARNEDVSINQPPVGNAKPTLVSRHRMEGLVRCVNGGSYNPARS